MTNDDSRNWMWSEALQMLARAERLHREVFTPAQGSQRGISWEPPTDVLETFRRELDAAWDEGGIFQLTMHPHIIGYRSRIWIVDELIRHAKSKGKVWFATHEQVARYAREHAA